MQKVCTISRPKKDETDFQSIIYLNVAIRLTQTRFLEDRQNRVMRYWHLGYVREVYSFATGQATAYVIEVPHIKVCTRLRMRCHRRKEL
jgi:hypothetical protein